MAPPANARQGVRRRRGQLVQPEMLDDSKRWAAETVQFDLTDKVRHLAPEQLPAGAVAVRCEEVSALVTLLRVTETYGKGTRERVFQIRVSEISDPT